MHQKEVGRIFLGTNSLGYTGCHRNGRYTCRTDQRVDLAACDRTQDFTKQNTSDCRECESKKTHCNDSQCLDTEEDLSVCCSAYGCAEHDRNNVAECVLCGIGKSSGNAGLTEQVTEHQHTKKRCYGRKKQGAEQNNEYREYNLLDFADFS